MTKSMLLLTLCFLNVFHQVILATNSVSSKQHVRCHDDESLALFQFKQSFSINESASVAPYAYAKVASWKKNVSGNGTIDDCCSWDGVACSEVTGHVIGLDLSSSFLYGPINSSSSLFRLVQLQILNLSDNDFIYSQIPSGIASLSQLTSLNLSASVFSGQIPKEISQLTQLASLDLSENPLLQLQSLSFEHLVQSLKMLKELSLSSVNISSQISHSLGDLTSLRFLAPNATLPQLQLLELAACNLKILPNFLRSQNELQFLTLSNNYIHGQIPEWFLNCSKETLEVLDLSYNFFTGFEKHPHDLPWVRLRIFDISNNMLQGSLPVPPPNTVVYRVAINRFTGEIPLLICQVSSLRILDLLHNNMTGTIPPCLGNKLTSLSVLMLKGNKFQGTIPNTFVKESELELIDISENQLEGQLPRSLANCSMLKVVNFAENSVDDDFPFWLGILSDLRMLILRSNRFHGEIKSSLPINSDQFPKLRILDLSHNFFEGDFPKNYVTKSWRSMKISDTEYENVIAILDLSSNRLVGEIPAAIGQLQGLQFLNLSNNNLTGSIPPSFANMTNLELLDLSQNSLSGRIPPQLVQLTSLAFLNVSQNNLVGPIPQGNQFSTFQNTSYEGNLGLCGEPLSKKC